MVTEKQLDSSLLDRIAVVVGVVLLGMLVGVATVKIMELCMR